ncbi:MAG TPA: tRNA uridine-5-carboxymethylaminomethyl(34) synthesis GTPase MnmE [Thermomicrobiales bacterium]|nr:tRNA uridine-5-carboxymethylaminomethyl(34) synthesis GTPase MnmE [Thermomicrobiales bacterium]
MIDNATIAAIATPAGEGGIGVVRISGNDAAGIAQRVFHRVGRPLELKSSPSHRLHFGRIVDPATGDLIDEVLLGWMASPRTYTKEDTVEISCHGGPVPLQETLRVILESGARHAEPGEFTLRAFLNGRLDLTQAEAVLNVIGARTAETLRLAVSDLAGDLSRRLEPANAALVSLLAYLDASADFPDDEIETSDIDLGLTAAGEALADVVAGSNAGMLLRDGVRIALVGRPNVGKSSLLNALLRSDRAIVTPIAGTTRDVIAETINLQGIPATLLDTAGIVDTDDVVERIGVERSRQALATAAAIVFVLDGSEPPQAGDLDLARLLTGRPIDQQTPVAIVRNKSDLNVIADLSPVTGLLPDAPVVPVSAVTGTGLTDLESTLVAALRGSAAPEARPALISARQRAAVERALRHIRDARDAHASGIPQDLLATSVRAALHAVGEVTGEDVDESVIQEIFSRFCIGK